PPPPPPPPPATYAPAEKSTPAPVVPTPEATYKAAEATPAPAPPVAETYPTDYKSIALWHHNQHRLNHTTLALLWDDTL
ncbi:hypothetical protein BUE80_DR013998, partial [Diplocarpon rosae]